MSSLLPSIETFAKVSPRIVVFVVSASDTAMGTTSDRISLFDVVKILQGTAATAAGLSTIGTFLQTLIHVLFLSIKARDFQSQAWGCCIMDRTISSIQVPSHRDLETVRMLSFIDFAFILEVLCLYDAILPEVPTPAEFSLPYTDLELTTSDGVKLKCYLLLQHPDLHVPGATKIEWDSDGDDEKYDMVNHTSKLDGPCSSSMSDPIV